MVGFLKLAYTIAHTPVTKIDLARDAIHVEREILRENVGVQDQLHTSFGGINKFEFDGDRIRVTPLQVSSRTFSLLRQSIIPALIDQNLCAQSRSPMDMILHGWSTSLFHASQQWSTISS
jgi:galactokinase/mevalonate kinase-like predicted kinase